MHTGARSREHTIFGLAPSPAHHIAKSSILDQAAVERAAELVIGSQEGWKVMIVRPGGRNAWTISYTTSGRFRSLTIPVESDTTEADAQQLINKRLP